MIQTDIALNFKGGGSIVTRRPIFSTSGESIFVCWKNSLLEYSTKTGKLLYEYKGSSNFIVGFSYHIYDSYQCIITCSRIGKVTIWKTETHYKILEKELPVHKVRTFHIIPSEDEVDLKALVTYKQKKVFYIAVVDIKNKSVTKTPINVGEEKYFIDISGSQYFSIAFGNTVCFVRFKNLRKISRYVFKNKFLTCIACHPSEEVVLTGDNSGRVIVWRNIFEKEKVQAIFHWHTLPVRTVSFSTAGSYFYSGGEECVLVKWQLDNVNDRKFLPRIAAEIETISVANNNVYIAVATSDNAVRILDSQMDQITLIQHLVLGKQHKGGIVFDPRTKSLVMNGNQGQVQFYSPSDLSLLYNVDIVGQNKITNERELTIENTEVVCFAISKSGTWLATVEERNDKQYHNEIRLKFWRFNSENQLFELNTSVEYPHEKSVNSMLFQPVSNDDDGLCCITVGNDRKFKIWKPNEVTTVYKQGVIWNCFATGFFRDIPCVGLSFSADGSLMATGFGSIATAWTPDSCELKCSLTHLTYKEKITFVQFGYSNQCHLLVSAGDSQLCVWNLLTLCMIWAVPVNTSLLVADPLSTHMAVIANNKEVFIFSPISPVPVYSSKTLLKKQPNVVAATFVPSWYSNDTRLKWYERNHLYVITKYNELFSINSKEDTSDIIDDLLYDDNKSVFSMMMPNSKVNLAESNTPHKHLYEKDIGHKTLKKYLDAPIHTMVPIRFACHALLKSLVIQKDSGS